jgi:hypothetical protein
MSRQTHEAIRRVLKEASEQEHVFDLSDVERLTWMIGRAYELGRSVNTSHAPSTNRRQEPAVWRRKRQTSR